MTITRLIMAAGLVAMFTGACRNAEKLADSSPQFVARFDLSIDRALENLRVSMLLPANYRSYADFTQTTWSSKDQSLAGPWIQVFTKAAMDESNAPSDLTRKHPCGVPDTFWDGYRDTIVLSETKLGGFLVVCERDSRVDAQHRVISQRRVSRVIAMGMTDLWCTAVLDRETSPKQLADAREICGSIQGRVWLPSRGDPIAATFPPHLEAPDPTDEKIEQP